MFKKTLLAAVLTTVCLSSQAYQIGLDNDFNVEIYGVAALSVVNYDTGDNDNGTESDQGFVVENESRIGFRAGKAMTDSIEAFMQVESGYVGGTDWGHGGTHGGVLGFRDTFVGLKGNWGKVRVGRVLTPLYEIVDWPFSNPGLGSVFDWGGLTAHYDRQSNQVRYDQNFGDVAFAASVGRDSATAATGNGGNATKGSYFYASSVKYTIKKVTLMGAVETGSDFKGVDGQDNLTYIVGFEAGLPGGFSLAGAYKKEAVDNFVGETSTYDAEQDSVSVIAQYWNGPLGVKLGYAANFDEKHDGSSQSDTDSNTISAQVMGSINGFVPYVRVAGRTVGTADTDVVTRVGLEYGF
ncbi:porin [Psychromonas antarctica]|jgi:predicted porin|uniref:porin n=1 Tax=Psychromonas antarctica TaxID=67573 RepID=UPI0023B1FFD3|nr:porin [Psychromonas antarctica]